MGVTGEKEVSTSEGRTWQGRYYQGGGGSERPREKSGIIQHGGGVGIRNNMYLFERGMRARGLTSEWQTQRKKFFFPRFGQMGKMLFECFGACRRGKEKERVKS